MEKLSDSAEKYLKRLHDTDKTHIIPIFLDVFKELKSRHMITDHGRRIQITPLGYQYIENKGLNVFKIDVDKFNRK